MVLTILQILLQVQLHLAPNNTSNTAAGSTSSDGANNNNNNNSTATNNSNCSTNDSSANANSKHSVPRPMASVQSTAKLAAELSWREKPSERLSAGGQ